MSGKDTRRRPALPDWHLWSEVVRTVSPLQPTRTQKLARLAEGPLPLPQPRAPQRPTLPAYRPEDPPTPVASRGALEPRMRRRLGRGQIAIDASIDLHGMRQAEAHAALHRFVRARAARGDRTLLVITGKGARRKDPDHTFLAERGVLRTMLPIWLSEPGLAALVAGWDNAVQAHGGEGAFYVRLKRQEVRR